MRPTEREETMPLRLQAMMALRRASCLPGASIQNGSGASKWKGPGLPVADPGPFRRFDRNIEPTGCLHPAMSASGRASGFYNRRHE